jgi:hypothetical protein
MTYAAITRAREIYGVWHLVRSYYFCGVLIWRVTKPQRRHQRYRNLK